MGMVHERIRVGPDAEPEQEEDLDDRSPCLPPVMRAETVKPTQQSVGVVPASA